LAILGALLLIGGVAGENVYLIVIGAVLIAEGPVLPWIWAYLNRQTLGRELEVTFTSEGIEGRTDSATLHLTWDKLERIYDLPDMWIFAASRAVRIVVPKRALSPDQQAELAAFIAANSARAA
jgi:hypothetical protein